MLMITADDCNERGTINLNIQSDKQLESIIPNRSKIIIFPKSVGAIIIIMSDRDDIYIQCIATFCLFMSFSLLHTQNFKASSLAFTNKRPVTENLHFLCSNSEQAPSLESNDVTLLILGQLPQWSGFVSNIESYIHSAHSVSSDINIYRLARPINTTLETQPTLKLPNKATLEFYLEI